VPKLLEKAIHFNFFKMVSVRGIINFKFLKSF
jgi:hypothetical protein